MFNNTQMNDVREMMIKGRENAAKRIQLNKHILFDVLDAHGVDSVEVTFDGSGDSGSITDISFFDDSVDVSPTPDEIMAKIVEGAKVLVSTGFSSSGFTENFSETPITVRELIESITYDGLKAKHEGWENNDGAYGEFNFDCDSRNVTMEYYERSTEYDTHEF
jgi:hypothetical protein